MDTILFKKPVEGALYMFDKGFKVFPIRRDQKIPAVKNWQDWAKRASEERIKQTGTANPLFNWAVLCDDLIVIDVDNKGDKKGSQSIKDLENKHGKLPETFTVSTPTGGEHRYFRGQGRNTTHTLAPGIDTRAKGGYVLAPGSRIGGRVYEVAANGGLKDCPQWLAQKLATKQLKELKEANKTPKIKNVDSPAKIKSAIEYLKSAPICVQNSGEKGGEYLLQVFFEVRDLGISKAKARELVLEHYNDRCDPPWDMGSGEDRNHFELKLRNAYTYAQNEIGAKTPEAEFTEDFLVPESEADLPIPLKEFKKGKSQKRKWILENWLPPFEISSIYGGGSAGKSLLSLQLGLSVSTGIDFLGLKIKKKMPVIGMYCEDSKEEIHRRLDDIRKGPEFEFSEIDSAPFLIWPRVGKDNALVTVKKDNVAEGPFMPKLKKYLDSFYKDKPKLLILDTLSDIYVGNENIREQVNRCIKVYLGSLVREYNCTLLLLAHPSMRGKAAGDLLSGSTAWENAVRNRIGLSVNDAGITVMQRLKSNYAKSGEEIELEWQEGRYVVHKRLEDQHKMERRDLAKYLSERIKPGRSVSLTDIAVELNAHPNFNHIFGKATQPRRRKERLMKLLNYNIRSGNVRYKLDYVGNDKRTRYSIIAEEIGKEVGFDFLQ